MSNQAHSLVDQEGKTGQLFDEWAEAGRGESMAKGHRELVEALFELWPVKADSRVLDVGCGVGGALQQAAERGAKNLAGLDLSRAMIEAAKTRLPEADLQSGSAQALPWPAAQFSHAFSIEALYYVHDPLAALKEMARVLKPGGQAAMVIEFFEDNAGSRGWSEHLPMAMHLWSQERWVKAFEEAGFENVQGRRIVREADEKEADFQASRWFPSFALYKDYVEAGALCVIGSLGADGE